MEVKVSQLVKIFPFKIDIKWSVCVCVAQLSPTLCNPIDCSPPGPSVHGILQARTLEWVAISFSKRTIERKKVKSLNCVRLFATPQTVAHQIPLSTEFSRQEHWSGLPFPSQGIFSNQGLNLLWQVDSFPLCHLGSPSSLIGRKKKILETCPLHQQTSLITPPCREVWGNKYLTLHSL